MGAAAVKLEDIQDLSAMQLRDALLVLDPLNKDWVVQINQAEAEFWKR
jgi:L-galactono-1,4-lactone dehydrogenase